MKSRYFEHRKGRVEIIPMIDVMLFLLVFFIIVTLQMIPDAGVNLQLPQASQVQHLPHPKVTVNILADGSLQVKGQTLTPDDLTALLAADGNPNKTQVTIAADKQVAFQFFVKAMDASRKAGVTDIGIAAQPTGPVTDEPQQDESGTAAPNADGQPASSDAAPKPAAAPSATTEGPAAPPQSSAAAPDSAPSAAPPGGADIGSPATAPPAPSPAAPPADTAARAPAVPGATPPATAAPPAAPDPAASQAGPAAGPKP